MSDEPSSRLRLASGYFLLTGGFGVLATGVALLSVGSAPERIPRSALAIGITINLAFCLAHLWAGRQLAMRSRRGGGVAIGLLLIPVVNVALGSAPSLLSLLLTAVGIAVIVSVWEELR